MGKHIASLSSDVLSEGKTQSKEVAEDALKRLEEEFQSVRRRMGEVGEQAAARAKELDETVHRNPYWFLAGAAGVAYLLGKTRRRH